MQSDMIIFLIVWLTGALICGIILFLQKTFSYNTESKIVLSLGWPATLIAYVYYKISKLV